MLLDDLSDLLSTGTSIGTADLVKGWLPDTTSTQGTVALHEVGGLPPIHCMSTGPGLAACERPRVQIVVRDADYANARYTMHRVYQKLDGLKPRAINGIAYHSIVAVAPPAFLRDDENGRKYLVLNVDIVKDLSTT